MKRELTEPAFEAFMRKRIKSIRDQFGRANGYTDGWPTYACSDTCSMIIGDLRHEFRGRFTFVFSGHFFATQQVLNRNGSRRYMAGWNGHSWIKHSSGKWIDPTFGQVRPNTPARPAYILLRKNSRFKKLYEV